MKNTDIHRQFVSTYFYLEIVRQTKNNKLYLYLYVFIVSGLKVNKIKTKALILIILEKK